MKVLAKTRGLYQVPKLRNATAATATTTTITTTTTTAWDHGGFHMKVLAKTPGLYQVPKLRNATTTTTTWDHTGVLGGGPRENPRSLSSPKAEKFPFEKS